MARRGLISVVAQVVKLLQKQTMENQLRRVLRGKNKVSKENLTFNVERT